MSMSIAIIVFGGFFIWICYLFYNDARIANHGVELQAKIISMKAVSSNENGSTNVRYKLLVEFPEGERIVEGKDTIATFYSSQLEPGKEIRIKYLDDKNLTFLFRE